MTVRRTFVLLLLCFAFVAQLASAASPNVLISQVYGGGGNSGATLKNDFIELFNRGNTSVSLTGWSVQYASSAGTTWQVTALSGSIAPGQYFLVQEGAGAGGTTALPAPDATGGIAMSATAGKVALVSATAALTGACPGGLVDFVGFGSAANCFEGAGPTPTLSNTIAALRAIGGCTDTDNNNSDFATGAPNPRNTSSPLNTCPTSNLAPTITAPANPIATVPQGSAPFDVALSGNDDGGIYNWSATPGAGVTAVVVTAGQGTANATFNVTLNAAFSGTATFTASLSDTVNPAVTQTVNISVTPTIANDPPTITPFANPVATVAQDAAPFTVSVSGFDDSAVYNWSATAGTGVSNVSVTAGQGTANATYTVTLQPGFSGTAAFTAVLSDNVNPNVTHPVTITVIPAPPPPLDHIVISQIYGGGGNSGATYRNDYVELYNPTTGAVDVGGWTVQYASATGTGVWQAQPLGGIMQPGEYYLISLASGGAVGALLPAANILGEINMSATAGKVALVSGGDPLEGCPVADPIVVDLVGYGGTANCREGATNAPGANNTTAIFRKNGGFTDTDVNGADFVTGAPNPRRTTPIVEIGPYVLSTDPRNNATTAPRDANITVNFTETVDVSGAWFNIACVSTGLHNDATVAGAGKSWIIIPNVNFLAGEQCTATVYQNFVHDTDLDDSGPNTDTLTADYIWTFTVATGTAPAYPADVHLTMGNPTGATADINVPNDYLMEKPELTLSYNRDRGTPNWVSWHLANEWVGTLARVDTFRADPAVPPDWYRVLATDYFSSGFDRGHMVPNADRDPETSIPINQATFLMTNMMPQAPDNNQGPWADMENFLRTLLPANELYIVAGGSGVGGTGSAGFMTTLANGHVTVPAVTWKVALVIPKDSGDDVQRVTAAARTIAVIMPNTQGIRNNDWQIYIVSVNDVEALTGYDFYANVADAVENSIEAGLNGVNPPGVENQGVTVTEDVAKTFTLESVSPNSNPLTYTIVSGPTFGMLNGTGASQTYTPAPDFNGTDTFTFKVSEGTLSSNTATVTITVLEVNDAPAAADDAKSTNEDVTLQFAASTLTSNDSAGPANESSQTLTVSSVSSTANTNGTVSLNAGVVTYTPAANFHGPASFTYQVCDNGVTGGLSDSKCATATVSVDVASVNDAPSASISAPATGVEGTAITATVSVADADAGDSFTAAWTVTKNGAPYATGSGNSINFTPDDNGSYVVAVTATDGASGTGTDTETVIVSNVAPVITSVSGPVSHLSVGSPAAINVSYLDAGAADTHTATFTWGDGTSSTVACAAGTCTGTRTYTAAGIYTVSIIVADDDAGTATATFSEVIVFDVNGGEVSADGSFTTPAGKKGELEVDAKYHKKESTPKGDFELEAPGVEFESKSFDWLVITGSSAHMQGTGTFNDKKNYAFRLTVTDAATDTFRLRIWNKTTGATVYDTVTDVALHGKVKIKTK